GALERHLTRRDQQPPMTFDLIDRPRRALQQVPVVDDEYVRIIMGLILPSLVEQPQIIEQTDFDRPFAGHLNRIDSAKNPSWFMYLRLLRADIGVYHSLRITKQDDYSLSSQKSEIILRWKNMLLEQHALAAHFVHELGAVFPTIRM